MRGRRSCEVLTDMLPSVRSGVHTFRVVLTDMLPSIRSRVHAIWWVARAMKDMKRVSLKVTDGGRPGILTHRG